MDKAERTPRLMRLPKNSQYPEYEGIHEETDWCVKVGCTPVCNQTSQQETAEDGDD